MGRSEVGLPSLAETEGPRYRVASRGDKEREQRNHHSPLHPLWHPHSMAMDYSQDHPATPSSQGDHSPNGLSIPFSPNSHGSPLQSPRRSPAVDEPSSLPSSSILSGPDRPFLPTRASTLGSTSELDHSSHVPSSLPKHSFSEDLNHFAPSTTLLSASRPNTPGSSSHDRSQPSSTSEHLGTSYRRQSAASGSSHSTSSSPVETRPPPSVISTSSATLVS
jgi:hypothetical protein